MTEQEAKTKRCCGPEGCGVPGNPFHDGGPPSRWCDGSACMGWRWQTDGWTLDFEGVNPIMRRSTGDALHGYCGTAGKP